MLSKISELNQEKNGDLNIFAVALVLACSRMQKWGIVSSAESFRNELMGEALLICSAADTSEQQKFMEHFYSCTPLEELG